MRNRAIKLAVVSALAALSVSGACAQAEPTPKDREVLVQRFVDAFNQQDADAMMAMMTPQIQWFNVDGATIAPEGSTREAIGSSMRAYFKSCPTCRSRLTGMVGTAQRLSAVEVAQWQGKSGPKEQRSLSVYEFTGPLINRVYYFPAEK